MGFCEITTNVADLYKEDGGRFHSSDISVYKKSLPVTVKLESELDFYCHCRYQLSEAILKV